MNGDGWPVTGPPGASKSPVGKIKSASSLLSPFAEGESVAEEEEGGAVEEEEEEARFARASIFA